MRSRDFMILRKDFIYEQDVRTGTNYNSTNFVKILKWILILLYMKIANFRH